MVFRKIEDETILVPVRRNVGDLDNIYVLNDVAAMVWELIDGKRSLEEIRDAVYDRYDVSPEVAYSDIKELIGELEEIKAVTLK